MLICIATLFCVCVTVVWWSFKLFFVYGVIPVPFYLQDLDYDLILHFCHSDDYVCLTKFFSNFVELFESLLRDIIYLVRAVLVGKWNERLRRGYGFSSPQHFSAAALMPWIHWFKWYISFLIADVTFLWEADFFPERFLLLVLSGVIFEFPT